MYGNNVFIHMSEFFIKIDNALVTDGPPEKTPMKFISGGVTYVPLSKIFLIAVDSGCDDSEAMFKTRIKMEDGTFVSTDEDIEPKLSSITSSSKLG